MYKLFSRILHAQTECYIIIMTAYWRVQCNNNNNMYTMYHNIIDYKRYSCKCIVCPTRRLASHETRTRPVELERRRCYFSSLFAEAVQRRFPERSLLCCIIIISIPTRRRRCCCTRNTDRNLYLPHTCVSAFTSVNLPEYTYTSSPAVRPSVRPLCIVAHTSLRNHGRFVNLLRPQRTVGK